MIFALDTNCILRWLLRDNERQAHEVDLLLKDTKSPMHIADLAIAETVFVLKTSWKFDNEMLKQAIMQIIEHPKINCNRVLFAEVASQLVGRPAVSFADIYLVYCAQLTGADALVTFDKTLHKRFPNNTKLL